jgi:hypothetical protein
MKCRNHGGKVLVCERVKENENLFTLKILAV